MKRIVIISALLTAAITSACSHKEPASETVPSPSPAQELVTVVSHSDRLYTTEYVVNKAVTYDDIIKLRGSVLSKKFSFKIPQGDRKIIIPMQAHIKAYIDFSGFSEENVQFSADSTKIRIILPDPRIELASTKIDHHAIKQYVDFGRSRFSQAEMADFEQQGRMAIIDAIPQMGITETARLHAYNFLMPMIEAAGFSPSQVTIEFRKQFDKEDYTTLIDLPNEKG